MYISIEESFMIWCRQKHAASHGFLATARLSCYWCVTLSG